MSQLQSWHILKYKRLMREKREEIYDVRLVHNEHRKLLSIVCRNEELEQVYYKPDPSTFPLLKMKEQYLYVLFNSQNQGFRLTFRSEDKFNFISSLRKTAFISESPAKNLFPLTQSRTSSFFDSSNSSFSQPTSSRQMLPPRKYPAARNLSAMDYRYQSSCPSPMSTYSQPVYDPYTRPHSNASSVSSVSSVSSSIGSALTSLSQPDAFFSDFSQGSSNFSAVSTPFTPPEKEFANKCIQTENCYLRELIENPELWNDVLTNMDQKTSAELITLMMSEIEKLPREDIDRLKLATRPDPPPQQPAIVHLGSDLEIDFERR